MSDGRTVTFEPAFWRLLALEANAQGTTVGGLVGRWVRGDLQTSRTGARSVVDAEPAVATRSDEHAVEFKPAVWEQLKHEADAQGTTVGDLVRRWIFVEYQVATADRYDGLTVDVEVPIPAELWERARLERDLSRQRGGDVTVDEILLNVVEWDPEFVVDVGGQGGGV